jgi:hypothetical protein
VFAPTVLATLSLVFILLSVAVVRVMGTQQRLQSSLCYLHVFDCAEDHIGMVKGRLQSRRRWGEMRKRLWRDCQSRQTRSDRFRFAS